jgi:isopenicillin N synthase-like dioxygenase
MEGCYRAWVLVVSVPGIHRRFKHTANGQHYSLKNHGLDDAVNRMFDVCAETLDLPLEEKMKFEQGDNGDSFGFVPWRCERFSSSSIHQCRYKALGAIITDKNGTADTAEFLNIAQDDALSWPQATHRTYPEIVNAHMEDTFVPFVRKSMVINNVFLSFFEKRLQLPPGTFGRLHSPDRVNGGETRCVRTPPNQHTAGIGAHTDFGSLVST